MGFILISRFGILHKAPKVVDTFLYRKERKSGKVKKWKGTSGILLLSAFPPFELKIHFKIASELKKV